MLKLEPGMSVTQDRQFAFENDNVDIAGLMEGVENTVAYRLYYLRSKKNRFSIAVIFLSISLWYNCLETANTLRKRCTSFATTKF